MKTNRLLIGLLSLAIAGMPMAQLSAKDKASSALGQEMSKIYAELSVWTEKHPKAVNALGLGAVGGSIVGALKVLGKRTMAVRAGRGAIVGAVVSAAVRSVAEAPCANVAEKNISKANAQKAGEAAAYEAGLTAAAVVALLTA